MNKYQYFTEGELACRCGCGMGQDDMDKDFMDRVVWVRRNSGIVMPVTSAIRCPNHNSLVSKTGLTGPHTTGHAIDIQIYGSNFIEILGLCIKANMTGIGINQKGPYNKRFLHVDNLENNQTKGQRPWSWSY